MSLQGRNSKLLGHNNVLALHLANTTNKQNVELYTSAHSAKKKKMLRGQKYPTNTLCFISNILLYSLYYAEARNEFTGPISTSLRPGNTTHFEEMLQR